MVWLIALLAICGSSVAGTIKPDYIKITQVPTKQRVDITIGGELFTSLLYADSLKKPSLYPIYTAKQNMVTRGWPIMPQHMDRTDYSHQFGLWFNYGSVNGADYWDNQIGVDTLAKPYGYIKLQKVSNIISGEGKAGFTITCRWINPGSKAVIEETSVFVFKVEHGVRIIDRSVTLKALTNVEFKDSKQGLYGFRGATELGQPVTGLETAMLMGDNVKSKNDSIPLTGHFTSSEGVQGEAVFAKRAKWMKLTGLVHNESVTLLLMDHPQNINYPAYWLARSNALMSLNPFGAEVFTNGREKMNFTLAKGKQVNFKYRFVQGGKDMDNNTIERLFSDFTADSL
ncbi:MAG: hypothetical protein JWR05_2070 [Mucilaginibacter sp.]|nr:hypothetical protein [Mucilaginibacter sp.]